MKSTMPTMHQDIAKFCRGCAECRKVESSAYTVPLLIIMEQFSMDMIGKEAALETSMCLLSATRYPEVVAVKNTDTVRGAVHQN
jgi:hypothetical protein